MPKLKPRTLLPTDEEDAKIKDAVAAGGPRAQTDAAQ